MLLFGFYFRFGFSFPFYFAFPFYFSFSFIRGIRGFHGVHEPRRGWIVPFSLPEIVVLAPMWPGSIPFPVNLVLEEKSFLRKQFHYWPDVNLVLELERKYLSR